MSKVDWSNGAKGFVVAARKCLEYACFGPDPSQAPTIVMLHEGLGLSLIHISEPTRPY